MPSVDRPLIIAETTEREVRRYAEAGATRKSTFVFETQKHEGIVIIPCRAQIQGDLVAEDMSVTVSFEWRRSFARMMADARKLKYAERRWVSDLAIITWTD